MPLHPQSQAFIDNLVEQNPPGWETMSPPEAREIFETFNAFASPKVELASVVDQLIDGIPVRVYRNAPPRTPPRPAVVYFHGGGWVLGSLESHDALCRTLAKHSNCVIVAVDYGLAPENPFPGPLNDCRKITRWLSQTAESMGVDANRIAVAGDSAGGNLAAAVALSSVQGEAPSIALQMLIYPVIEPDFETDSYREFASGFGLTRENMRWFWQQYVGDPDGKVDPLAALLRCDSLRGLPPAHVITAEYDVLRDEGEAFARKLEADGVPTSLRRIDGVLHGFVHLSGLFELGEQTTVEIAKTLREELSASDSA